MEIKAYDMALAFQRGEEKGFAYFFDLLRPRLQYYAFRILKDEDEAADAVEDGFIKIWANRQTIHHPKQIKAWMYTTVRNLCLNSLDKRKRTASVEKELIILNENDREESNENQIIRAEVIGEAYQCFKYLPKDCRQILTMLYKDGLTTREAATRLGLTISTIKNQKGRGLKLIKDFVFKGVVPSGFKIRVAANQVREQAKSIKSEKKKEKQDKIQKVVELRNLGYLYKDIEKEIGISKEMCRNIYVKHSTEYNLA